jgi:hypothetical protein
LLNLGKARSNRLIEAVVKIQIFQSASYGGVSRPSIGSPAKISVLRTLSIYKTFTPKPRFLAIISHRGIRKSLFLIGIFSIKNILKNG